jgi:adenylate cyclase
MASPKFYWIEFIGDRSLKIEEGQTILAASLEAGIPHYHACGGNAKCSTCRILIKEGQEFLTPCNEKEKELRKTIHFPSNVRLACQTFVTGSPVHVHRIIRDETDIHLYIDEDTLTDVQNIGAEKELALFFLDIRNFTPFMENSLAFDVIHVMRRLFGLFRKCIELHSGRIIETVGDGLYAVFGLSEDIQTATNNACKGGLAILNELQAFNEQYLEKNFNHRFEVGIGLHIGNVIVGNIGIGVNNNLTAMGLPVNIASRLQAATKQLNNSFLVSEDAYRLLLNAPESSKEQIELKGLRENFTVHLLGKKYGGNGNRY